MKLASIFMLLLISSGCCLKPERQEPDYPTTSALGWRDTGGGKVSGSFVLKVGQTTEHADVRITVIGIINNNCRFQSEHSPVFTKLKFTNVANPNQVCDLAPVEGSVLFVGPECAWLKNKGIEYLGVSGINTRENWVYFDAKE